MPTKKKLRIPYWSILSPFATIGFILFTSALIIAYARGYRLRPTSDKIVNPTGILAATSDPVGAQVIVDGQLKTATNTSFSIDPGNHTIRIAKDGYFSWQKDITIDKEVVSRADAFLFPINPSLSVVTNSGIIDPILSDDGTKIMYISPATGDDAKNGDTYVLWMYELADRPLGFNRDPKKIADIESGISVDSITLQWSPDSTEVLFMTPSLARIYKIGKANDLQIITGQVNTFLDEWKQEDDQKKQKQLSAFKQDFINFATSSASIISFSPDETKVLYEATASATLPTTINPPLIGTNSTKEERTIEPGKLYIYDSKEDKNYFFLAKSEIIPSPTPTPTITRGQRKISTSSSVLNNPDIIKPYPISWFPTNKHLILSINKKIDILEYDRTNWITVYAGPFEDNLIAPWPGGSRIVVVTNLNPGASPLPNLYTVNLR